MTVMDGVRLMREVGGCAKEGIPRFERPPMRRMQFTASRVYKPPLPLSSRAHALPSSITTAMYASSVLALFALAFSGAVSDGLKNQQKSPSHVLGMVGLRVQEANVTFYNTRIQLCSALHRSGLLTAIWNGSSESLLELNLQCTTRM